MPLAGLYYDSPGWLRLAVRHDPILLEELRDYLGGGNYKYSSITESWYVREPYREVVTFVLRDHGYTIVGERGSQNGNPWVAIFEGLSPEKRVQLYRKATLVLHPDKGGDGDEMKRLNQAWREMGG